MATGITWWAREALELGPGEERRFCGAVEEADAGSAELLVHALAGRRGLTASGVSAGSRSVEATLCRPRGETILDAVRRGCCALDSPDVLVDIRGCVAFARRIAAHAARAAEGEALPYHDSLLADVPFETLDAEISALVVLDMLNFGSGYKRELALARIGRYKFGGFGSAFVTMLEGTAAAARAGPFTSERMAAWSAEETELYFMLPAPAPGAASHAGAPALGELNCLVTSALRSAGCALRERGHASPGSFVLALLPAAGGAPHEASLHASTLVEALASTLPPFADFAPLSAEQTPVPVPPAAPWRAGAGGLPILKKAQLLASSLHQRLGEAAKEPRLRLRGLELLTVAADPVLPAVLRAEGCLAYSERLEAHVRSGAELPPGPEETAIRASAVAACEAIRAVLAVEMVGGLPLSASGLDLLLWGVLGKSEAHRDAPRHVTKHIWWH